MASGRRTGRVEPTFGSSSSFGDEDLRLSAEDRAVASDRPARAKRGGKARRDPEVAPRRTEAGASRGSDRGERRRGFFGRRPRRSRSFTGHLVRLAFFAVLWGGIALAGVVGWFAMRLPQEAWAVPARPPNVKIVSVSGDLLADRGITGGEAVSLDHMSPFIPKAVMAIEDRRFYSHYGIDPLGIVRALTQNMAAGETVQGGSTLTQQLAKNIFLNPEQTIERKIQEAILALWLEHKFTKDQILEMYLNRVYFGSGATGVQAAARRYFNKNADEVTLSEAALLAGLLKAPSRLSPARDPAAAKARSLVVLQAMRDENFISAADLEAAKAEKPAEARSFWTGGEHYAADMVMRDLKTLVPDITEDVVVETTIDLPLEKAAEKAIRDTVDGANQNVSQGALVSVDGTGAIRAVIGGRDYGASQFNRAVDAKRQPGSAFKPFVYQTALEYGVRPETVVLDEPVRIGNWSPQNYDLKYRGQVTVADALAKSLNTVAVRLTAQVGPAAVIDTAQRMGITSPLVDNASLALGTSEVSLLELTGAYAPFANGGYRATPHLVNRVTTVSGRVLYERGAAVPPVIVTSDIVGMMNTMLTGVIERGTGRRAALKGWQAAGKSGTTQDSKDAWFVGYTANLTTGVWLGNDNGKPMRKVTGGTLPAEAWHSFMVTAHEGLDPVPLPGDYSPNEPADVPMAAIGDANSANGEAAYPDTEMPADGAIPPPDEGGGDLAAREPAAAANGDPRGGADEDPYADDGAYARRDPYGDDAYGGAPEEYGGNSPYDEPARMRAPEPIAPRRVVRRGDLPPDAVLEGPVGRSTDRSLFHDLFGGG